jgi:hypothetical protein
MKITDHSTGKTVGEADPDYLKVQVSNLEQTVRELTAAVGELQHRLSAMDGRELEWPISTPGQLSAQEIRNADPIDPKPRDD